MDFESNFICIDYMSFDTQYWSVLTNLTNQRAAFGPLREVHSLPITNYLSIEYQNSCNPINWKLGSKSKYCKPRKLEIGTKIHLLFIIRTFQGLKFMNTASHFSSTSSSLAEMYTDPCRIKIDEQKINGPGNQTLTGADLPSQI